MKIEQMIEQELGCRPQEVCLQPERLVGADRQYERGGVMKWNGKRL